MKSFTGIWNFQEMEDWELKDLNEEGQSHLTIGEYGSGRFHFGYTRGIFDSRVKTKGGKKQLYFKWQGSDGDHEDGGMGWIELVDKDTIEGELTFEYAPDTKFIATRRKIKE